ncbi:MAG: hypothetical protein JST22_20095 [Bacteroidetes bacterium]|nr:hypothetical protein [Bacteroidota bacterium]
MAAIAVTARPAAAQPGGCAEMVRGIYQRMAGEHTSGNIVRMRYTVRSTAVWKGKAHNTVSDVELLASDNRLSVISPELEVYQDATTMVTVLPGRKSIHIGLSNLARFRELRGSAVSVLRDSVLTTSDVVECSAFNSGAGGPDRKVVFRLRPGARDRLQMETVTVYLSTARQTIQKLQFVPTPGSTMTALELEFTAVDYNYSTDRFSHSLLEQFLDGNGHPVGKYKGYTIEDARNRNR